ncbi:MAG: type II toxin-antitoxin system RelE/ParE family toxin [Candidatus Nitrotoga sp.]
MNNLYHNATFNFSENAIRDLIRMQEFLREKTPEAALRARDTILASLSALIDFPEANRPVSEVPGHRELVIKFGSGAYVARYHYNLEVMSWCFL